MGLLKRGNKEQRAESAPDSAASKWENLSKQIKFESAEDKKKTNAERQQRKIITALLLGNGGVDSEPFHHHDVEVSEEARDAYLDKVATREIGDKQYRELLNNVGDPYLDKDNPTVAEKGERAFSKFSSAYEHAILQAMTVEGRITKGTRPEDMKKFYDRYPTPMDFENVSNLFLRFISEKNQEELPEYTKKMESFKQKVYGKKQEYWTQIKNLRDEAMDMNLRRERSAERNQ